MTLIIEKLQLKDLDEFFSVFSYALSHDFPGYTPAVFNYFLTKVYYKNAFKHWITYDLRIVYIVKDRQNNKLAGFAVLDKPYGGVCFLRWLGVLKEYRQKGTGRLLIEATINYAKKYGCHKIEVAGQPGSEEFYRKVGLNLEGKRELSYFGIDQHIFGKVIGKPLDESMVRE